MSVYYQDDYVTLYHGDCRDVIPHITATNLVTDPPYAVAADGSMLGFLSPNWDAKATHSRGYADHNPAAFISLMSETFTLAHAALPETSVHAAFCGNRTFHQMVTAAERAGFAPLDVLVFASQGVAKSTSTLAPSHELVSLLRKGGPVQINPDWKQRNRFDISKPRRMESDHLTSKPLSWMRALIELLTAPDAVVLDPFAGGGSTLVAARELGRRAIGVELEEKYCEITARRLSQEVLNLGSVS